MKKMCFVTTVPGTLRAFVLETAKYLHENAGYDITFICDNDEEFKDSLPAFITYIPVSMKRGISASGIISVIRLFKIFKRNKYDLVQYSTPNASLYASIAAKIAKVPVRLYCQWGLRYVACSGISRKILKSIEKIVCSLSTWIEPDSYGNLKFSHQEGLYKEDKGSVVGSGSACGINLERFDISKKEIWKKEIYDQYEIDEKAFVIGFVGRITRDKGINELYSAVKALFQQNKNSILLIVGDDIRGSNVDEDLYQWSRSEKRILYCGRTIDVQKFMAAMDVLVLPSYREGFGSVIIEAEAMGTPVIVTDIPGPSEAMLDGETGILVKKADADSLVSALQTIVDNPIRAKEMGQVGREFVEKNFDQKILLKKILEDRKRLLT